MLFSISALAFIGIYNEPMLSTAEDFFFKQSHLKLLELSVISHSTQQHEVWRVMKEL